MFGVEPSTLAGRLALEIYSDVLAGVRADTLVASAVRRVGSILFIHDSPYDLQHFEKVFVCGAGKASAAMAAALGPILGDRLAGGLVVTQPGGGIAPPPIQTLEGAHPVPDERSLAAGEAMLKFASETTPRDLVLFCLSGGASALMEATRPEISLDDLQAATNALLNAGADIRTLNAVRVRLSRIKGGGLARAFSAHIAVLVLSDVLGNDLSVVGSASPFLAPRTTGHRAHAVAFGFEKLSPRSSRRCAALTNEGLEETHLKSNALRRRAAPPCYGRWPQRRRSSGAWSRLDTPTQFAGRRARWRPKSCTWRVPSGSEASATSVWSLPASQR